MRYVSLNKSVRWLVEQGSKPYWFLLLDNFTMLAFSSAVEPMRMANQLTGKELYDWYVISEDGDYVEASDGITIKPDCSMADAPN